MRPNRREFLIGSVGIGLISAVPVGSASATPAMLEEAIRNVLGESNLQKGKITLDVPPPMTEADHVKAIHVFNEKNPQPHVISVALGPRAGKASVATRIKLADTQRIVGIAEMSDGSFWTGEANVIVTIAACVEDVN